MRDMSQKIILQDDGVNSEHVVDSKENLVQKGDDCDTYVVILSDRNSGTYQNVSEAQFVNQKSVHMLDKLTDDISPLPRHALNPDIQGDEIRLNLNHGFDNYDSSNSSLKVFSDDQSGSIDEGFINGSQRKMHITIPKVRRVIADPSVHKDFSPSGTYVVYGTPSSDLSESNLYDTHSSSGYVSDIVALKDSYETPNAQAPVSKHPASRQIFLIHQTHSGEDSGKGTPTSIKHGKDPVRTGQRQQGGPKQQLPVLSQAPHVIPATFSVAKSSYLTSTPNSGVVIQSGRNSYLVPDSNAQSSFSDVNVVPDVEYHTPSGSKVTLSSKSIPQLVNTCKFKGKNKGPFIKDKAKSSPNISIDIDKSCSNSNENLSESKVPADTAALPNQSGREQVLTESSQQQLLFQRSSRVGDVVVHVRVENSCSAVEVNCDNSENQSEVKTLQDVTNCRTHRPISETKSDTTPAQNGKNDAQRVDLPFYNLDYHDYISIANTSIPFAMNVSHSDQNHLMKLCQPADLIGSTENMPPCGHLPHNVTRKNRNHTHPNQNSYKRLSVTSSHRRRTTSATQSSYLVPSSSQDVMNSNSQDSLQSESSHKEDELNDSLTSMQWLRGIKLKPDKDKAEVNNSKKDMLIQWRHLGQQEIQQIAEEYGKTKRPPFSYMTLIQMALNSKEDKRMTLREICNWIEVTFPYYKCTAKSGWKNSIRHNLSLYSIFEREQSKKHGSHWTIREDSPDRTKVPPPKKAERMSPLPSCLPVTFIPQQPASNAGTPIPGKTGLQPILPRPNPNSTPLQTYALIPIQSLSAGASQSSPLLPDVNQHPKKQGAATSKSKRKKCVNIAPKVSQQSLLRQAWLNAQALVSDSDTEKSGGIKDIEDPLHGLECVKKSKTNSGLPKPKIYSKKTPPRKSKTRRKQKLIPKERELMQDSSDEEVNFIAAIEKDVLSSKNTENIQPDENVSTSTPFKSKILSSPQFLSPIRGLTPLRNSNILDNSLLDCLKESDNEGIRNILGSPDMLFSKKLSPSNNRSPNMSLLFSGLTPLKGDTDNENNQNLSSLLAEIEEEDIPANLSNISWNTLCQNINPDNC